MAANNGTFIESEFLRSKCTNTLKQLLPSDSGDITDYSPTDINTLRTIFHVHRNACRCDTSRLAPHTMCFAINSLIGRSPYQYQHRQQSTFTDMRRYLLLLTDILGSFCENVIAMPHHIRDRWYSNITALHKGFEEFSRKCPPEYYIEKHDIKFLLKHCQYLVISIRDARAQDEVLFEYAGQVVRGALQGYSGQYLNAMETLSQFMARKRIRSSWHETFVSLERLCFNVSARSLPGNENTVDWDALEHQTMIALRDTLDEEFQSTPVGPAPSILRIARNTVGLLGRTVMSAGQYEDNDHFFKYGLLDLMHQLLPRVQNRRESFEEVVSAIHSVLQKSGTSGVMLFRKATDLFHEVCRYEVVDGNVEYGIPEERQFIKAWIAEHAEHVEKTSFSNA